MMAGPPIAARVTDLRVVPSRSQLVWTRAAPFVRRQFGDELYLAQPCQRSRSRALAAAEMVGGRVLVAVVTKRFDAVQDAVDHTDRLQGNGVRVSAGLGDGAADQWERALGLALHTKPSHLNQVFPAAALSQRMLQQAGAATVVNALVRPSGTAGLVQVGTGPHSQANESSALPVGVALDMLVEVGVRSVKFFPMGGAARLAELSALARAAAKRSMMVEPTGGIGLAEVANIVRACRSEGVPLVMPHLYGSLKDPATNDLDLGRLRAAVEVLDGA